jgi:hypothetical protein
MLDLLETEPQKFAAYRLVASNNHMPSKTGGRNVSSGETTLSWLSENVCNFLSN